MFLTTVNCEVQNKTSCQFEAYLYFRRISTKTKSNIPNYYTYKL